MIDFPLNLPDASFQFVSLQSIDFPDDFIRLLSEGPIDPVILKNTQEFGQLQPLLVQQQVNGQHHLLANYHCYTALKMLSAEKVACHILPSSTPPIHLYSIQILIDLASPQASPILQAHLLRKAQHDVPEKEQLRLLALMGCKPQRYKLKEFGSFLQLELSAILALHHGILSQKSARQLTCLSHEDQRHMVHLINTYRLGGSKQQKLVEMVTELIRRDNKPIVEIIGQWLPENQETTSENMPQRLQALMQCLQEQCYPAKSKAEQHFHKLVQELHPPEKVTIKHSLSFEDDKVEVCLSLADTATLRQKWEIIKTIVE
jgi:ParB family chromosome partitioning protein